MGSILPPLFDRAHRAGGKTGRPRWEVNLTDPSAEPTPYAGLRDASRQSRPAETPPQLRFRAAIAGDLLAATAWKQAVQRLEGSLSRSANALSSHWIGPSARVPNVLRQARKSAVEINRGLCSSQSLFRTSNPACSSIRANTRGAGV